MQTQFINPNFHVILIHYPLALIGVGLLIELFAFLWRRSTFRMAGRWMLLIGILSLVPAATSGLYALSDVNRTNDTISSPWRDTLAASPVQGQAWEMLKDHAWLNATGTAIFLLAMVIWLGSSDIWRGRLHFPLLFVCLVAMSVIVAGAWNGGEMIYRHGVAVKHESTSAESEATPAKHDIAYYAPPLQVHVILAGYAIAVGLAAMGLSMRAGHPVATEITRELGDINAALNPGVRAVTPTSSVGYVEDAPAMVTVVRQSVSRFWLIAALIGVATIASGWWFHAVDFGTWDTHKLLTAITDTSNGSRRLAHTLVGAVIVAGMVLMALVARMAAGRKFVVGFFSLLLVLSVIAQLWFGGVLLLDTAAGPLANLNPAETTNNAPASPTAPTSQPTTTSAPTTTASVP